MKFIWFEILVYMKFKLYMIFFGLVVSVLWLNLIIKFIVFQINYVIRYWCYEFDMFVGNYRYWFIFELENLFRMVKLLLGIKMFVGFLKKIMYNN